MKHCYPLSSLVLFFLIVFLFHPTSMEGVETTDSIISFSDRSLPDGSYLNLQSSLDDLNADYFVPISTSTGQSLLANSQAVSALWRYYINGGKASELRSRVAERTYVSRLCLPLVADRIVFSSPLVDTSFSQIGFVSKLFSFSKLRLKAAEEICLSKDLYQDLFLSSAVLYTYSSSYLSSYRLPKVVVPKDIPVLVDTVYEAPRPPGEGEDAFWPKLRLPPRKYWLQSLESTLQLSQNYVSSNWYKGGASNLNLFSREYLRLEYNRGKIRWINELESKLNIYNASGDSLRRYRIADDVLRLHTNYGYKAFSKWFYTLDAETRTQLFSAYKANTRDLQAAPLAPLHIDVGLGMKYDLMHKSRSVYGRSTKFSLNIAPLSYNLHLSLRKDLDLERHGFPTGKTFYHTFGSSIKAELTHSFNMNVSLQSRLYVTTTYSKWLAEWENSLNMSFSRYFSTRLYIYLRYDDSAPPSDAFGKYLQLNELLSIGFNYRW